ncbi:MAG: carbohydrate kinase family protein [Candidatus Lokiarchaeota archaeon]|nr:carbohydrate kinase family protein [Candidatus Lokiarchaeota archaeon]
MTFDIIVLGDLYEDLYYESNFYEEHAKLLASKIFNFIKYTPDDLNKNILEKIIFKGFSDRSIQNNRHCYFKRGGNGSNISEIFTLSGIPTKLVSIIRREGEWMVEELAKIGVDTTNIIRSKEILPIRIIVTSNNSTNIILKPNSPNKWVFNETTFEDYEFQRSKLIFCASLSNAYIEILDRASKLGLLTAFSVEDQNFDFYEKFGKILNSRHDILFLNINDASVMLEEELFVEQIDKKYSDYAKIRVFISRKKDTVIKTDKLNLHFPSHVEENEIDYLSSKECFQGGFLIKFLELIDSKDLLNELLINENIENLKGLIVKCEEFAVHLTNFKNFYKYFPNRKDLEKFIMNFKK